MFSRGLRDPGLGEFLSLNAIEHYKFAPKSRFGESLPFENLLMKLTFKKLSDLRNCHSPALLRISPFAIRQSLMKLTPGNTRYSRK
jgi:hypothetical protein